IGDLGTLFQLPYGNAVATIDTRDYYRFTLSSPSTVRMLMRDPSAAYGGLFVYDSSDHIRVVLYGRNLDSEISHELTAGEYHVEAGINLAGASFNYAFDSRPILAMYEAEAPGNTLSNGASIVLYSSPYGPELSGSYGVNKVGGGPGGKLKFNG